LIRKQETAEKKAQKAAEVQARKDAREAAKQAREAQKSIKHTKKSVPMPNKALVGSARSSGGASTEEVLPKPKIVTSRGRAVKLPTKLLD
jgi:septal ring factor EnvC (AmiA/AmiB activator)